MAKMERQSPYEVIKSQNEKKLERSTRKKGLFCGNRKSRNLPIDEKGKGEG
jgi:hypothetical protein